MEESFRPYPAGAKAALRKTILAERRQLPAAEVAERSLRITEHLIADPLYQKARVLMAYAPCNNEVDLSRLIQTAITEGKQVALPLSLWEERRLLPVAVTKYPEDLTSGRCGILEPQLKESPFPLEKLDLVLVPGVAFDVNGYRLGYGQGFYDRFLRELKPGTRIVGAAYSFQIVASVYPEAHDYALPFLVSENGWFSKSQSRRI